MRTVNVTFEIVFTSRGWMDSYVVTKISRIHKLPFFLTRGAPLRVLRERQSSEIRYEHWK